MKAVGSLERIEKQGLDCSDGGRKARETARVVRWLAARARGQAAQAALDVRRQRHSRQLAAGRRIDDARQRGLLSVQELWLRAWALGGDIDLIDVDGFLAGLLPLGLEQRALLLQALRERRLEPAPPR